MTSVALAVESGITFAEFADTIVEERARFIRGVDKERNRFQLHVRTACFGAMAIISPCCIRPNAWAYWGRGTSHHDWHQHLKHESLRRGLRLHEDRLPMSGASTVLYGRA